MSDNNNLSAGLGRLNVNAAVFVPSFGPAPTPVISNDSAQTQAAPSSPIANNHTSDPVPESSSNTDHKEDSAVADDWEANAEDDEEEEDEEEVAGGDEQAGAAAAVSKKKRSRGKVSESGEKEKKDHLNIVFIGHVDAGKSTIGGQILNLTGMVDKRTLEKYEREAKEKNRESWYLSWALDTNQEERDKGKTVEVGRAFFTTEHKHFTLLDAPGHKGFVPNMIGGACQADLAILVISARKGEFETGFERGGQTREHAMLAKTAGVRHLVILINKMDDATVNWSEDRYKECKEKILPYLKKCGFKSDEMYFMPCSGFTGSYLLDVPPVDVCPWFRGPSFLSYIDALPSPPRAVDAPFRMPIVDKYKDMGTVVMGKVEAGQLRRGSVVLLMPNRKQVEVLQLWLDDEEVSHVVCGENVKVKLKGVEEDEVTAGFVLCCPLKPCSVAKRFQAQVAILETKSIICNGYSCVMHIHTAMEDVTVRAIAVRDKKTNELVKTRFVKQDQQAFMSLECVGGMLCMETFSEFPQMGRITLRDEGRTVAIGKIMKVQELDAK